MLKNISNLKNAKKLTKADQGKINGGIGPISLKQCYGIVSFSLDGICPPDERLIGHCICCKDEYVGVGEGD